MNKAAILVVVAVAFGGTLWMKSQASSEPPATPVGQLAQTTVEKVAGTSVLLFADPREAETSCGCAEVIRLARAAGSVSGVSFREFDTRTTSPEAEHHGVRVSPTVIITDAAGIETRLEGESREVLEKLRKAVNALGSQASAEDPSTVR